MEKTVQTEETPLRRNGTETPKPNSVRYQTVIYPKTMIVEQEHDNAMDRKQNCPVGMPCSKSIAKFADICLLGLAVACVIINLTMVFTLGYLEEDCDYIQALFFSLFPLIAYATVQMVANWISQMIQLFAM